MLLRPERIFLLFSILFGVALCLLIPPLGGGNEAFNFQRAVSIAYGHPFVEKAEVPEGIVIFIDEGKRFFHEGLAPPFSYSRDEYHAMASIPLDSAHKAQLLPNPIAVHPPFAYIPQALLIRLAAALGQPPVVLFYLARLGGLCAASLLTFLAIRLMPSHRYALCALALLPPITFSRSCVDADQVTGGLAFLFIACTLREAVRQDTMRMRNILLLAVLAFVLALCKNVCLVLPLLTLAIPCRRFASPARRMGAIAVILLPSVAAGVAWMLIVRHSYFAGIVYHTWAGAVDPDKQIVFILHHPFAFPGVLLRTLFLTPLLPLAVLGIVGIFGPPLCLPAPGCIALTVLFASVIAADATSKTRYGRTLPLLAAALFLIYTVLSLTLLYIQWTGLHAPLVAGFQGRYLYPLLPLLLVGLHPPEPPLPAPAVRVMMLAGAGFALLLWTAIPAYYG